MILVTGAAGFIGARFVESCRGRGQDVVSVDRRASFAERVEHRGIDFGTIIDRDELGGWLTSTRPKLTAIVHLGACTDTTELDLAYLERVNVAYSKMLWSYAAERGLPLVYASSAATYGDGALGFDDDETRIPELRPLNPYGDSKQRFDLWALAEERAGRKPPSWAGFKFFNVYGFGERHKGKMSSVVVQAFDQILGTGELRLFESYAPGIPHGEQRRDFIDIGDIVLALHFALEARVPRGIYNLGTGRGRTFLDLGRATFAAMQAAERIRFVPMPESIRERYQYFTEARTERLRALGFTRPFTTLEDGVRRYVERLAASSP